MTGCPRGGRVAPLLVQGHRWAPSHAELLPLVAAAGRVADHSSLRPWRLIELRGTDRERLGRAINKSPTARQGSSSKPLRAPLLLIAVVASYRRAARFRAGSRRRSPPGSRTCSACCWMRPAGA